jgi:hypothetical protein
MCCSADAAAVANAAVILLPNFVSGEKNTIFIDFFA